jgi:serine protease Do
MVRMIRPSLLFTVTMVLVVNAPLGAQRTEVVIRRAARAAPSDSTDRQLRRLERRADSLARLYNDSDDLTAADRRAIGESLDRTVQQIEALAEREARLDRAPRAREEFRVMLAPSIDERAATLMGRAFSQPRDLKGAMLRGWIGIVVSGTAREPRIDNGELIVRYLTHPEIVSVEPSSPAERAGITPSDTLIAYDGRDVRNNDISITRLLRPNARVLVRIRRDRRTFDVPVTVADVPSRIRIRAEMNVEPRAPRVPGLPVAPGFPSRAPVPPSGAMYGPQAPTRVQALSPLAPSTPLPAPASTPVIIFGSGADGVAGAQLAVVTEGLARTIGVGQGLLVTGAPVGSPAFQSGLREGDVIVGVAGAPIRTISELRERVQAAAENGDHTLELELVRDKRTRKAVLSWSGPR